MVSKQIIFPITTKQFLIVVIVSFLLMMGIYKIFASSPMTSLEICNQKYISEVEAVADSNTTITNECVDKYESSWTLLSSCLNALKLSPVNTCNEVNEKEEETLRSKFWLADCRFVNEKHKLPAYNLEWMAYDIACEVGKSFDVKSPWSYAIVEIGYWSNLGNYIILRSNTNYDTRIVLGHTKTSYKVWQMLNKDDIVWQTDVSWASTWVHVHIELWSGYMNVSREFALGKEYKSINWTALLNHRKWGFGQPKWDVYYFTAYNLWDVKQNDSTPCIGASGKDLCYLEKSGVRTMALTSDVRSYLSVEFWDQVKLTWDVGCSGIYQVEDEMNLRFRQTPWILRPWTPYYIKGDLPSKEGWACSITKL